MIISMGKSIKKSDLLAYNYFELGINKKYGIASNQITNLRKWLNRSSISADYLFNEQSEYLVSLKAYPFYLNQWFNVVSAQSGVPIGPFSATDTGVLGRLLSLQKPPVKLGEFTFNRYYNNFMDYAPHTTIRAYLPFIDFVEINVNMVMGKTVEFYGQIDFDNGLLNIWMECDGTMIQSWQSQIGIEIAINRTNATNVAENIYRWSIATATGIGSLMAQNDVKANAKAVSMGGQVAQSFIDANKHHVYGGNIARGVNMLYNPTSIYLIIGRDVPEITDLTEYKKLYGLPCEQTLNLSDLSGFTQVDNIHLENFSTATSEEIALIESELRDGVIL